MNKQTYGKGNECFLYPPTTVANTVARVSTELDLSGLDNPSFQLIAGGGLATLDGAWKIEVSNDFERTVAGNLPFGQIPATAHWTDITASAIWVDAIAAVTHGGGVTTNQYIQPKYGIGARYLRVTFTGTTGSATVAVIVYAKSWS